MAETGREKGVAFVGAIMVDEVCQVSSVPRSGECSVVQERRATLGGCAFNSANIARQLGAKCLLFAPVGKGLYARFVADELERRGLRALQVDTELDCGSCLCLVEPCGERTMITTPGIERHFESSWFEGFDNAWADQCGDAECGIVVASGYEINGPGGDAIIAFAEAHPEREFWYAPGPCILDIAAEKVRRINALSPLWHLNDMEACKYAGVDDVVAAGEFIARECGGVVVVTEGARGSHAFLCGAVDAVAASGDTTGKVANMPGEEFVSHVFVPSVAVKPVDTIGAGDAHVGALAAARAAGFDWEAALALANQAAGAVCQTAGATLRDDNFALLGLAVAKKR